MIVTAVPDLEQLVEEYRRQDTIVFDVETRYVPAPAELERYQQLKAITEKQRAPEDKAWVDRYEARPLDPLVNEVIWIGMATRGRSDAIPCGHPHGTMITPQHRAKVSARSLYQDGDPRLYTKGGKVSERMVEVTKPATFEPPPEQIDVDKVFHILRPLFFDQRIRKVNQNLKFDIKTVAKYLDGEIMPGPYGDPLIAQAMMDENAFPSAKLGNLVKGYFDHEYNKLGEKGVANFGFEEAARYAEQDAKFVWLLWRWRYLPFFTKHPELWDLHEEVEQRLYPVLMRQELRGLLVNRRRMDELKPVFSAKVRECIDKLVVDFDAPPGFNPNANAQVSELLYVRHKAPIKIRTEKTKAPSTAATALELIAKGVNPDGSKPPSAGAAELLLQWAEAQKILSTYFVGLGSWIDPNGRIHPDFTQYVTDTGRLSCKNPNLHNISRDSDIREMFISPAGYVMITADYDQIELRLIGMEADDPELQRVFRSGEDVHRQTAALVLSRPFETITSSERSNSGKMPNFLLGYGGSAWTLASRTGISVEHAEEVLEAYYRAFAALKPWKARVLREARASAVYDISGGRRQLRVAPYTSTRLGRRRHLTHLLLNPSVARSKEEWKKLNGMKAAAERQAINHVIQGTAAEVLKVASIDIDDYVERTGFPLEQVLNVHDEIVALVPERHAAEGLEIMTSLMSDVREPTTGRPFLHGWCDLVVSGTIDDHWSKE